MARKKFKVEDAYGMEIISCGICKEEIPKDEAKKCVSCGVEGCGDCVEDHEC